MSLKALIFDVDGTLAETEELHREAFNISFVEFNIPWFWDVEMYTKLLEVTGGKERIKHYAKMVGHEGIDEIALHKRKTEIYAQCMNDGGIELRTGVKNILNRARASGLRLAIATTTSRVNVDILLTNTLGAEAIGWFNYFSCGDNVVNKKPDPEIYLNALKGLGLAAENCMAFEDSCLGLASAVGAGIPTIITPSIYTSHHDFSGAICVCKNLDELPEDITSLLFPIY